MKNKLNPDALLKKFGLKVTPKRKEILSTMSQLGGPVTTQEIYEALPQSAKPDVATVYRNILTFVDVGLIKQLTLRPNIAHYELDIDRNDHHHIVCIDCGEIEELRDCKLHLLTTDLLSESKKFSEISGHTFELFGKCKKCK